MKNVIPALEKCPFALQFLIGQPKEGNHDVECNGVLPGLIGLDGVQQRSKMYNGVFNNKK